MQSNSSGLSFNSAALVATPRPSAAEGPKGHDAWGSFVPLNSATHTLRAITAVQRARDYDEDSESDGQSVTFEKQASHRSSLFTIRQSRRPPLITRTPTDFSPRPPSPDSSASSINLDVQKRRSDLHPVLARMERSSKFCAQKMECSTCRKPGRDFPKCGKCQKMWCSRECRLVGGKRHVCSN
ncbi:hypothetical protein FA15DRAFT_666212 [Coprinopsis marcescibilis]|uniref:Uncharacterized protein n=1 Tax=Coprinopsis marcescibilis TaxID=230819 RepID=A0A5C3L4R7_COPMA|nr:hypothetical protein FA15DRAFT_666212 [Coprinopsis marcescibilis]